MKVVYLKNKDPIAWTNPHDKFSEEDLKYAELHVLNRAGIVIKEDKEKIVLAEVSTAKDNPMLEEYGVEFPIYRDLTIIDKKSIIERRDFEVNE